MKVRSYEYSAPIQGPCTVCGQPFKAGDSVTLSPPMHRTCDATATLIDTAIRCDFNALTQALDDQWKERD